MSRNVRFKLSAEELEAVSHFSFAVNMPIDTVAKQSLFWAINEAHKRARREAGAISEAHKRDKIEASAKEEAMDQKLTEK